MSNNWNLEKIIKTLDKLKANSKPLWGEMSAQRMVEHLTDTLEIANGKSPQELLIPEEKIEKMQAFLETDKPMARNIEVPFAPKNKALRNDEIEEAIDEFVEEWLNFEELYTNQPEHTEIHAFYGPLNYQQWLLLNNKHLNHHFEQFGLI
jgi:hypothetical protein